MHRYIVICEYMCLYDLDGTHTRGLHRQEFLRWQNNIFFLSVILRKF